MSNAVRISDKLYNQAHVRSKAFNRSTAGQIEYWAKIGQIMEDNPDLPFKFVQDILIGREEAEAGQLTPYVFGEAK